MSDLTLLMAAIMAGFLVGGAIAFARFAVSLANQ